jgi:hypothetical protein
MVPESRVDGKRKQASFVEHAMDMPAARVVKGWRFGSGQAQASLRHRRRISSNRANSHRVTFRMIAPALGCRLAGALVEPPTQSLDLV